MRDTNACDGIFKNKSAINTVFAAFFVLLSALLSRIVALLSLLNESGLSLSSQSTTWVSSSLEVKKSRWFFVQKNYIEIFRAKRGERCLRCYSSRGFFFTHVVFETPSCVMCVAFSLSVVVVVVVMLLLLLFLLVVFLVKGKYARARVLSLSLSLSPSLSLFYYFFLFVSLYLGF